MIPPLVRGAAIMGHSTIVTGALLAGFVLYLAAKNRLATYIAFLTTAPAATAATTTGSGTVGGATTGNVVGITGTPGASATATVTPVSGLLSYYATPQTATVGDVVTGTGGSLY